MEKEKSSRLAEILLAVVVVTCLGLIVLQLATTINNVLSSSLNGNLI